jgi:hypothetical protein
MGKHGKFFISTVSESDFIPSVWDPHVYRRDGQGHTLSDFAMVQKVNTKSVAPASLPFSPIEYRDIPRGHYLSCALRLKGSRDSSNWPVVGEGELLFGTMRAYLGNVVVTPLAEWLDQKPPIYFHVKSEFVVVSPYDGLPYFWLAYLRSKDFLEDLPLGSGGTRPRVQPGALAQAPVKVPPTKARKAVHEELVELARKEWRNYLSAAGVFNSLPGTPSIVGMG